MTVKELKEKLNRIDDDTTVEMVLCSTDNPLFDTCTIGKVVYCEYLQETGKPVVVIYPE